MKGFYNFPNFIREMSDLRIYIFKRLLLGGEVGSLKIFNKSVRGRIQSQLHPSAPKINKKTLHKNLLQWVYVLRVRWGAETNENPRSREFSRELALFFLARP